MNLDSDSKINLDSDQPESKPAAPAPKAAAPAPEPTAPKPEPTAAPSSSGPSVRIGGLIQPTFQVTAPAKAGFGTTDIGAPSGPEGGGEFKGRAVNPSYDFFVRRAALTASIAVIDSLSAFISIEMPLIGQGGRLSVIRTGQFTSPIPAFIQDAFLTYDVAPWMSVDAGFMPVPFARHTIESAADLNTYDFHAEMIRLPAGKNFRDVGVQARGLVGDHVAYRLGAFQGVRNGVALDSPTEPANANYPDINPDGYPRLTAQVRAQILGREEGFFLSGIYFAKEPVISVGVGADYQPGAVFKLDQDTNGFRTNPPGDYTAFSADAFVEYPFSADNELLLKLAFFQYGEGWSRVIGSEALEAGGTALFAELGFRHQWIEPVVFVETLTEGDTLVPPNQIRDAEVHALHAGANFWINQHTFNVKADLGHRTTRKDVAGVGQAYNKVTYRDWLFTVQSQVAF